MDGSEFEHEVLSTMDGQNGNIPNKEVHRKVNAIKIRDWVVVREIDSVEAPEKAAGI